MANLPHAGNKQAQPEQPQEAPFTIATAKEMLPSITSMNEIDSRGGLGNIVAGKTQPQKATGNVELQQKLANELVNGGDEARTQLKNMIAGKQISLEDAEAGMQMALNEQARVEQP